MHSLKLLIPNVLTLFRGVAAIVIVVLFLIPHQYSIAIYWLFVLSALTDFFDGYLARKWKVVSDFGVVFDPLFDKILVLSLIFLIYPLNIVWGVFLIILFIRDITTDVFKNYLLAHGVKTPAIYSAKIKTTMQMLMLHFALLYLIFPVAALSITANVCAGIATIFSLYSGGIYARRFILFMKKSSASSMK